MLTGRAIGQQAGPHARSPKARTFLHVLILLLALSLTTLSCGRVEEEPVGSLTRGPAPTTSAVTRVTCIDVGKGDCILVESDGGAVLIDTGYRETVGSVLSCLAEHGIGRLDALVLTHYDRDHVGGFRDLAEALEIDAIYLPSYVGSDKNYDTTMSAVKELGLAATPVTKEVQRELGRARLVIHPAAVAYVPGTKGREGNDNDASLVVTLRCDDDSYLFAGDLEEEGVDAYLAADHGHFDVIKMPHHGEGDANTDELIDDVQPTIALITDGDDDPADKKTLKLLKKRDVQTYCTSDCGTIVVEGNGTGEYSVTVAQ